jgi:hypothetical protein
MVEQPALTKSQILERLMEQGGVGLEVVRLDGSPILRPRLPSSGIVRLGLHRQGDRPEAGLDAFDILLTADPAAAAPWVSLPDDGFDAAVDRLKDSVARQPLAASVVTQILRSSLAVPFEQAQVLESFAYSMLLASAPFRTWRAVTLIRERAAEQPHSRVLVSRERGVFEIRLNRPDRRNAVDARMRDSLIEALQFAIDDPEVAPVLLSGAGPSFCSGGDLDEFGQADDPGVAHLIRVLRAPATLIHRIRDRVRARVHGACIGAGIEIPAAAASVTATSDAYFQLPELAMGLIPGAGGTASLPRRIGRHRTCFMALSGLRIDARTALAWRLIDSLDNF